MPEHGHGPFAITSGPRRGRLVLLGHRLPYQHRVGAGDVSLLAMVAFPARPIFSMINKTDCCPHFSKVVERERERERERALNVSACGQTSPIRYWLKPETKDALFARPMQRSPEIMPNLFDRNKFIMRCLLYPRKRTFAAHSPMSALGQKRTKCIYSIISAARRRKGKAERVCSLQIDQKFKLGGLINRNVAGFSPFENLVHVIGHALE
jgi:hypothetical protein